MATLGSLIISLEANTAAFNSAMDRSAYMAQQSSKRIQDSLNGISSTIKGLVATALTMATIERIWEGFKNVYEAEKILEKMAIRLGTTSAELSALQYAAKKSGIGIDVFNTSIQRMEKNISTAALPAKNTGGIMGDMGEEVGKSSEAFRNLGINANALKMLPLKEQLLAISERLKLVPNEADKVRIALDIFGKGGGGMVVMLKAGEEAIDAWIDRGRELGVVLDNDMVKRGAAAGKSIGELKDAVYGFGLTLADTVAPPIKLVTDALTEKLVAIRAADPALRDLVQTVKDFAEAWAEPALNALKMGVIGGRIAGLQGAALGAAAGFAGLTTSLRELADALQNPLVLAFLGGAAGSRLGIIGAGAGALAGATAGIALGIKKDAAAYQKSMQEDLSGYESPIGGFEPGMKAQLDYEKSIKKYQGLFTEPSFGKPSGGGKKGGGGGAKDTGLDRMQSIIDGLQKDLSRLTEGSLAEIEQWAKKTINEIEKVGKKGAETETALSLVAQVEAAKKKKATEDYELFVAKESGNSYVEIEAQARAWSEKYKGFADAEKNISIIKNRKIWEQQASDYTDATNRTKSYFDILASSAPLIEDQFRWKGRSLDLDVRLSQVELERWLRQKNITGEMADQYKALLALTNQSKKFQFESEKMEKTGGLFGGVQAWAMRRQQSAVLAQGEAGLGLMGDIEKQTSSVIGKGIVGVLKGQKAELDQIGWGIGESIINRTVEWGTAKLFDLFASVIQPATSALISAGTTTGLEILTGSENAASTLINAGSSLANMIGDLFGGGGGGGFLDIAEEILGGIFHQGGVITAHRGWPLAPDERLIKAEVGERVLSRSQNRVYEAGMSGGATINAPISITINPRQEMTQADYDRHARMIKKSLTRHLGNEFNG